VSPPAPADVPPPPQVPWQQVGPAQAVAPAGVPPPLPSRGASPQPPGAAPAQPQAKLPLLTDEQNKTYAAQLEHQQATMGRVNAFLGTPEGKNVDRVTTAMVTAMVTERGTVQNLPYSLQHLEAQKLPPDQQRAEVDKLLGKASDYDQKLDRLEGRADRISTGRDPGPDLPLSSRAEYEAFANRGERMRGLLVRCDRAMDPKAPVQPDAAMQKQTMEMLNANRYMLDVPRQLKELEAKNLDPGTRSAEVAKVMTPMPEIDKRMDGMNKTLKDFSVAQLGDRAPKPLPGLTPDQQAEFADRSARMRGMLNHLDRMMDPKAPRQPDAAMKTQTLELLNANRYMLNLPSELKEIDKQNLDPATKQAQIDKLMAPMAVVDKRMDATAKSINDFYVGKDRPPAQLAGVTQEQNKEYALRSRRMDAMLEGLDRMNDPKLPIQPSKTMQKETLELLRANTHLKELPKNLERLDAQNLDPRRKASANRSVDGAHGRDRQTHEPNGPAHDRPSRRYRGRRATRPLWPLRGSGQRIWVARRRGDQEHSRPDFRALLVAGAHPRSWRPSRGAANGATSRARDSDSRASGGSPGNSRRRNTRAPAARRYPRAAADAAVAAVAGAHGFAGTERSRRPFNGANGARRTARAPEEGLASKPAGSWTASSTKTVRRPCTISSAAIRRSSRSMSKARSLRRSTI
jgi:hypothetical protein